MKTITIQIGNTDDKLTQKQWANFYADVNHEITQSRCNVHFSAPSPAQYPWQNACWVIEINHLNAPVLRQILSEIKLKYSQDSIAWTEGETQFI